MALRWGRWRCGGSDPLTHSGLQRLRGGQRRQRSEAQQQRNKAVCGGGAVSCGSLQRRRRSEAQGPGLLLRWSHAAGTII